MKLTRFAILVAAAVIGAAAPASATAFEVGHRVETLTVSGSCPAASQPCDRPVKVRQAGSDGHLEAGFCPGGEEGSTVYARPEEVQR